MKRLTDLVLSIVGLLAFLLHDLVTAARDWWGAP